MTPVATERGDAFVMCQVLKILFQGMGSIDIEFPTYLTGVPIPASKGDFMASKDALYFKTYKKAQLSRRRRGGCEEVKNNDDNTVVELLDQGVFLDSSIKLNNVSFSE